MFPKPLAPGHVLPMDHGPAKPGRRRFFSVPDLDSMRERVFSSTKLVKHAPDVLFNVVKDVARYDEFVPFCASSRVVRAVSPTRFEAELEVGFKVFSETYRTISRLSPVLLPFANRKPTENAPFSVGSCRVTTCTRPSA